MLSTLSEAPGDQWRASELATRLLWSSSRLAHHVGRMEKRGLVARQAVDTDGRGATIVLTAGRPYGPGAGGPAAPRVRTAEPDRPAHPGRGRRARRASRPRSWSGSGQRRPQIPNRPRPDRAVGRRRVRAVGAAVGAGLSAGGVRRAGCRPRTAPSPAGPGRPPRRHRGPRSAEPCPPPDAICRTSSAGGSSPASSWASGRPGRRPRLGRAAGAASPDLAAGPFRLDPPLLAACPLISAAGFSPPVRGLGRARPGRVGPAVRAWPPAARADLPQRSARPRPDRSSARDPPSARDLALGPGPALRPETAGPAVVGPAVAGRGLGGPGPLAGRVTRRPGPLPGPSRPLGPALGGPVPPARPVPAPVSPGRSGAGVGRASRGGFNAGVARRPGEHRPSTRAATASGVTAVTVRAWYSSARSAARPPGPRPATPAAPGPGSTSPRAPARRAARSSRTAHRPSSRRQASHCSVAASVPWLIRRSSTRSLSGSAARRPDRSRTGPGR